MNAVRTYGTSPYNILVVHGGPGAAGEMKPIAEKLAAEFGVLEPFQTQHSIKGQLDELHEQIIQYAKTPVALIGYSWGAWLCYLYAAAFPEEVRKLILISAGAFDESYTTNLMETRLGRLSPSDRVELATLKFKLQDANDDEKNSLLKQFGQLMSKADSFETFPEEKDETLEVDWKINQLVWTEASLLRKSRALIQRGELITCPIVAIHGTFDPHPIKALKSH